jgi:sorting nexin-9/18/33
VDQLTNQDTNAGVKRRYKHFDWLHSELTRKYAFVVVPPLPGKQLTGT